MAAEPLIVIVGQTASGKSSLAMAMARQFDGEIICADARTVYKDMNIGTAKASKTDQSAIRHHLLDQVNPDESFNVAQYQKLAKEAISDIQSRNKLPIMVGGSGLYIDSVLFDYGFSDGVRRDPQNPRHTVSAQGDRKTIRAGMLVLGLDIAKDELNKRIEQRIEQMIKQELEEEVDKLLDTYNWSDPGLSAIGYQEWRPFFEHHTTVEEVKAQILKNSRTYAKRQKTWFKRNKSIQWVNSPSEAQHLVAAFLGKD